MSRRALVAPAVALFALLVVVGIFAGPDGRELGDTSFGTTPAGQRAALELLARIAPPVARSFDAPDALPPDASVLFVDPRLRLCAPAPGAETEAADEGARAPAATPASPDAPPAASDRDAAPLLAWIGGGGTALVLLGSEGSCAGDARIGEEPVPPRLAGALPPPRDVAVLGTIVTGELTPAPRALDLGDLASFDDDALGDRGWRVVARAGTRPFVLERAIGDGRLVLAADHRFVTNAELDRADAAPLLADLVRRYGIDLVDERAHGLRRERRASAYLVRSSALPFFLVAGVLGAVFAWGGGAVPARRLRDEDPEAPTLERYVASLAALYRSTRDHARALELTREATASRVRRHFGLAPETPLVALVERLRSTKGATPEAIDLLAHGAPVRSRDELVRAARLLDRLAQEVRR